MSDLTRDHDISAWAEKLSLIEIIKVRLCYTKHKRHRVAHQVVAGPGHKHMSIALWLKVLVKLRTNTNEALTPNSPLLVRERQGEIVPMTGVYMARMDKVYLCTYSEMVQGNDTQPQTWFCNCCRQMWGSYGGNINCNETFSRRDAAIYCFAVIEKSVHYDTSGYCTIQ